MAVPKSQICVVREKPRHPVAGQRPALDADGCGDWIALDEPHGLATLLNKLRRGDVVKLRHLHLFVPAKRRTDDNPRRALWATLHRIEDRGATIREVSTGRSTANQRERDMMIADAIEVISRGARGSADRARENGKLGGRPPAQISDDARALARSLWFERPEFEGERLRKALRKCGYSLARCYREFGPRGGREG